MPDARTVDESFLALPLSALTDAALTRAVDLGCEHADLRVERIRTQVISLRDARPESFSDAEDLGVSVRVVHEGTWGFAAGVALTAAEAVRLAEEAVAVAKVSAAVNSDRVELAPEPTYDGSWVSDYEIDPFAVPDAEKSGLLVELSERLMAADGVEHVQATCMLVKEQKYYADTAGTRTRQQRVRIHPEFTALTVDRATGQFESMRTLAPPVGQGWEYLTGTAWDWTTELAEIPELLREKTKAPSVQAGRYDLVIDPSNLFLTIHESIGHATELDRALGYEAAYAGTSFATVDKLGTLKYGSPLMNVTGDRVAEHGLSTVGWDDEGVAGQQWDIVKDGILVGYQVDRNMARLRGHAPLQRLRVRRLLPARAGAADAQRLAPARAGRPVDGGDHRRRRAGHLRRRRQELVDRHAALQLPVHRPAVLQDRGRSARRPAARRRLPGDDDGLLGRDVGRRRPADLRPGRRLQLRQGPAGADGAGQPRVPVGAVRERQHPQHRAGGRPMSGPRAQEIVERALAASTADGQVTFVVESSEANLRWASNSLTTNGSMRSRQVVVVSFVDGGQGMAAGTVTRSGTPDVADLVAASEQAARDAGPAEDAMPLITEAPAGGGDWAAEPAATSIEVFRGLRPGAGAGVRRGPRPRATCCSASPSTP